MNIRDDVFFVISYSDTLCLGVWWLRYQVQKLSLDGSHVFQKKSKKQ